jgi:DNA polymerase-1
VGDAADNIPGIEGVGPKTAAKLISECGSIDAILANPSKVGSETLRAKLVGGAGKLRKNQALIRLLREPPQGASWSDAMLVRRAPDFRRIREIAVGLDLHTIIRDLDKLAPETASDDLFAAPEPPKHAEKPAKKAPEKPASDQMEFDF